MYIIFFSKQNKTKQNKTKRIKMYDEFVYG
jgi:hypothetical protein